MTERYIHGYSADEQRRLIEQAAFWRDRLLLREFDLQPGERALEAGCGVGAVLAVLSERFPEARFAGIDLSPAQIETARRYLAEIGRSEIELVVGDAARLPWPDETFDRVYAVWFIEHLPDPIPVLREIRRVLKPGGAVVLNETDYATLNVWPEPDDYLYFRETFCDAFRACGGHPHVGRQLGSLLREAGYGEIEAKAWGYHSFYEPGRTDLREFIEYCASFLSSTPDGMIRALERDPMRLRAGLDGFRRAADLPDGSVTLTVYRAVGRR